MGLIQSVVERAGIPTVSISTLEPVSRKVRPPRVLVRDVRLGYPLGEPGDAVGQEAVILRALEMTREPVEVPWFVPAEDIGPPGLRRSPEPGFW